MPVPLHCTTRAPRVLRRTRRTRRDRAERERGAAVVETAFVALLLMAMLIGIVETAFLVRDWLTISSSTRAGARVAAAEPRYSGYADDAARQVANELRALGPGDVQQVTVYKANPSTGLPVAGGDPGACTSTCVSFTWNETSETMSKGADTWPAASQSACGGAARDAVGVYIRYAYKSPLGLLFDGNVLSDHSVMQLAPVDGSGVCAP